MGEDNEDYEAHENDDQVDVDDAEDDQVEIDDDDKQPALAAVVEEGEDGGVGGVV